MASNIDLRIKAVDALGDSQSRADQEFSTNINALFLVAKFEFLSANTY
jgi:hypothetical protein